MSDIKLLIQPKDVKPIVPHWSVKGVLNPAAIRSKDGRIILFVRIAEQEKIKDHGSITCPYIVSENEYKLETFEKKDIHEVEGNVIRLKNGSCRLKSISHIKKIILDKSGYNIEEVTNENLMGMPDGEEYGIEDPRISEIDGKYYMTYVSVSVNQGVSTALAESSDLKKWKRLGLIFQEQNKDVVLFPEKINNLYVALNRPESAFGFSKPSIWISYSKDLIYWGREKNLFRTRENSWDDERIGAGTPPIKTNKGWLIIYHGVTEVKKKYIYSAGAALLDLKNPHKVLARTSREKPLFAPSQKYEKTGFINNVVFPTGGVITQDGKDLLIYSGGGDTVISVRKMNIKEILEGMEYH